MLKLFQQKSKLMKYSSKRNTIKRYAAVKLSTAVMMNFISRMPGRGGSGEGINLCVVLLALLGSSHAPCTAVARARQSAHSCSKLFPRHSSLSTVASYGALSSLQPQLIIVLRTLT